MTKQSVLTQCSDMVAACWNHYAETPVSSEQKAKIRAAISKILTQDFAESENYKSLVEYNKQRAKESECAD